MKYLFGAATLSLLTCYSFAQQTTMGVRGYNQFNTAPQGTITSFALAPKEKPTSIYLYDYWRVADIYLRDSTKFTNLNVKVDLNLNVLDIQYNGMVKTLPFALVLAVSFSTFDGNEEVYLNGGTLFGMRHPFYNQLFQVIREGYVSLYSRSVAEVIEARPNPALALNIEDKVEIKRVYFIAYKQNLITVYGKSDLKEDLQRIFGDSVVPLLKKVNPKKEEDLLELVGKLDNLVSVQ